MKRTPARLTWAAVSSVGGIGLGVLLSVHALAQQGPGAQGISAAAVEQIVATAAIKRSFTRAEQKIDSNLVFAAKAARGQLAGTPAAGIDSVAGATATDLDSYVAVDISGSVSDGLLALIDSVGGVVVDRSAQWGMIRASLPLEAVETIAAHDDVTSIDSAALAHTNAGALTSQGFISHGVNRVIREGIDGTGVTVGVLSDSALPACVAALIASGDLPPNTHVLPGQQGPSNGVNEGCAMMEIVHDVAPGANLIFATAFSGVASFANNILALQAAGANVIVDDVTYFNEGAFQDGPIARAVNQVAANGAIYFSSAANSGSLTLGTSGTWEGDFLANGAVGPPIGETGIVHNFGTVTSPQNFDVVTVPTSFISLKWSDPLGASTNDYDMFVLDSTGTRVKGFSARAQSGTQDPYEFVAQGINCGLPSARGYCPGAGDRIVVVLFAGQQRALRIDTSGGQLSIATAGSTYGHNAGASTVSTAATYWNSAHSGTQPFTGAANPNETFSSDGPRKIFFNPNGTAITAGNFLFSTNGGITLQKPDIAAADGAVSKTPGFNPFFGTSASAPHAAGIAALILSVQPTWTPSQVLNAITSTALDSMEPGVDRDSGHGIVMAWPAVHEAVKSLED
jgi:subtilisin family serine protease